jgi:hypothetical protein
MRTLRWSLPLLLLLSTALAGCSLSLPETTATPSPSPRAQLSPAWAAVLNQIGPNGEISLATALQAYSLVFGPLPGVQAPPSDGGLIGSGTLAVEMILQHYHDLTAAQQQAVLQRLGLTAPASAQSASPLAAGVPPLALAHADVQALIATATATPLPTPVSTDGTDTAPFRAMIDAFIPKYNAYLGYTYTLPIVLVIDPNFTDTAYAFADPVDAQRSFIGAPALCPIVINPIVGTFTTARQQFVIAHELFHCYQAAIVNKLSVLYAAPKWLTEGSAEWAGAVVSGATSADPQLQVMWGYWLANPDHPLFKDSYDAVGFYSLLDQVGISPWKVLPAMLLSQTQGTVPDNLTAYQAGTQSAPQQVLDTWASSYERDTALGADWDLTGPGIPAPVLYGGPPVPTVTLGTAKPLPVKTPAYTSLDEDLTSQADVVLVSISGTSRLHDSASFERVGSANGSYCTKQGGCTCPPGSAYQGPALPQLTGVLHLAVTGGPQGANGTVSGLTLQQFCNQKNGTADTSLCNIISVAEFSQAVGGGVTSEKTGKTTLPSGTVLVSCAYLPSRLPGSGGGIFFAVTSDGPTYYAQVKQQEIDAGLTSLNELSGVGDAAWWGTDKTAADTLNLDMLKGNVVVGISMNGTAADGSTYLPGAVQMAKEIASQL